MAVVFYCKVSPHPYLSVMLDSMGIGALWGQICPYPTGWVGCGSAVVGSNNKKGLSCGDSFRLVLNIDSCDFLNLIEQQPNLRIVKPTLLTMVGRKGLGGLPCQVVLH